MFTLFTGFGLGALAFQALLGAGLPTAFTVFGLTALGAAVLAVPLFRHEHPRAGSGAGATT